MGKPRSQRKLRSKRKMLHVLNEEFRAAEDHTRIVTSPMRAPIGDRVAKPRMGPVPRADGEAAKPRSVRATDAEWARWQLAAGRMGLSLSDWVREACETAVARGSSR